MIKTISLTANEEKEVELTGGCHVSIENRGTGIIYASKSAGVTAGADGVIAIDGGVSKKMKNTAAYSEKNGIYDYHGKIYLLSDTDGTAEIETGNYFFDSENSGKGGKYEEISNKVTSITETSTDEQYPSAKAVYDLANAGYETVDLIKPDGIKYYSNTKICKFPNNFGLLVLNITWGSDIDTTYNLKIGEIPEGLRPAVSTPINIVSNDGTDCYIAVETDGTIAIRTINHVGTIPKSSGVRAITPYIIA